jgi:hypothetical protein
MTDLEKDQQVAIVKAAIKEWLDEKAAEFGKWTIKYVGALVFSALVYWLFKNGAF